MNYVEDKDDSSLYTGGMKRYELRVEQKPTQATINLFDGIPNPRLEDYQQAYNIVRKSPLKAIAWAILCKQIGSIETKLDKAICDMIFFDSKIIMRDDGSIVSIATRRISDLMALSRHPLNAISMNIQLVTKPLDNVGYGSLMLDTNLYTILYGEDAQARIDYLRADCSRMADALIALKHDIDKYLGDVTVEIQSQQEG